MTEALDEALTASQPVCALTVAGTDPTGGAGLQADVRVFNAYGLIGLSVVSAITAQNTRGVEFVEGVELETFDRQLGVLLDDIKPRALKTGVIYSSRQIRCLAGYIRRYNLENLVVDPVMFSSSGSKMTDCKGLDGWLDAVKNVLLPITRVFTPNMYEAGVFASMEVHDLDTMREAAVRIAAFGAENVIVTGGHLNTSATDVLYYKSTGHNAGYAFMEIDSPIYGGSFHGTGCTFSAAITACLARGFSVEESVKNAKSFIKSAIEGASYPGSASSGGMGILDVKN